MVCVPLAAPAGQSSLCSNRSHGQMRQVRGLGTTPVFITFVSSSKFSKWTDELALWQRSRLSLCLATTKSLPRSQSTSLVLTDGIGMACDGCGEDWQSPSGKSCLSSTAVILFAIFHVIAGSSPRILAAVTHEDRVRQP